MIVGAYTLHLYCETNGCEYARRYVNGERFEFVGSNASQCYREAREHGWKISLKERSAHCPECSAARGKKLALSPRQSTPDEAKAYHADRTKDANRR